MKLVRKSHNTICVTLLSVRDTGPTLKPEGFFFFSAADVMPSDRFGWRLPEVWQHGLVSDDIDQR